MKIVPLNRCEYDKSRKVLKLASEFMGMPHEFYVKSHFTNRKIKFTAIGPEDKLFDEDQWDGEQQIYRQFEVGTIDYMVIYNQY
jgi:hypothetical protein